MALWDRIGSAREVVGGGSVKRKAGQVQGIARAVLTPPFRFLWGVTTDGLDKLPAVGGAIVAPNHVSVLDSFFLPLVLPRRITYVGKAEYMDDWKTKVLFPAMGMIPIDRSGGDASRAALEAAEEILDAGELFGIYPEGTRSRDGRLHKGHTGIARLALKTGCPIVPVGIIGTDRVQPAEARFPAVFKRVHLRFGDPIRVDRYIDRRDDRMVLRQITDEVMYEIRNLSGQEYVDAYATSRPAEALPTAQPARRAEPAPAAAGGPASAVGRVADVVPIDRRTAEVPSAPSAPARAPGDRRVAAAAFCPSAAPVPLGDGAPAEPADGVERRSSAAVLRSRPLDLGA
jgi:1-acyl-sn-glycerol-3-phosphate acyltransferase